MEHPLMDDDYGGSPMDWKAPHDLTNDHFI